jgi:hypothetical protein
VASVGYRSAFVGAALTAVPGARTAQDPLRVLLSSTPDVGTGRPVTEVSSDLEAVRDAVRPRVRGQRWVQSQEVRRAIEDHAMQAAAKHYRAQGWSVEDVSGFCSYDLHCEQGDRVLKGLWVSA